MSTAISRMGTTKSNRGFTIVELLIVIVVIGILAAIVIVAFNGVQQRAKNTQRSSAASSWLKLISMYGTQYGALPPNFSNNHVCLGTGYPNDLDGVTTDEDCHGTNNIKHPSTTTNNALAEFGPFPSFPGEKLVGVPALGTAVGVSVRSYDTLNPGTPDAKTLYPMMHYWLFGTNSDCGVPGVLSPVSGTNNFSSASSVKYTASGNGFTQCVIMVPDPARS